MANSASASDSQGKCSTVSARLAIEQVNSPLARMLRSESLVPPELNITIGGRSLMALKKL